MHASADVVPVADTAAVPIADSAAAAAEAAAAAVIPARPISFDDISLKASSGLAWRRKASATRAAYDAVKVKPFMSQLELNQTPLKSRGAPGVALLDYDGDGDVDIYVTNGPGRANSLFQNQLAQTGQAKFIDVALTAGVGAADQDSTGVCYGDIDNDGDEDLFVLGRMEPNRLFRNDGGTFSEIATSANVGGGSLGHASCTMGDINNDGLLDILVANSFDWARQDAIYTQYFGYNHRNQLYINRGANHFDEVLGSTGADKLANMPPGDSTISWAAAFVDIDQDGDVDIIHADDQAAMAPRSFGGVDRGYLQTFKNNGTGQFTNVTASMGLNSVSQWMGLAFGDLNSDGIIDMFATSMGAYFIPQVGMPIPKELTASRWWIGGANGFTDPGRGALGTTPTAGARAWRTTTTTVTRTSSSSATWMMVRSSARTIRVSSSATTAMPTSRGTRPRQRRPPSASSAATSTAWPSATSTATASSTSSTRPAAMRTRTCRS
ncbi:ASPIC/UnbV domain-containing protein [Labilithrix luteola]|uniref:ASPIC/UnbV domain-containing protein n=1 Tax=Labilithrix luteola TaxID=1391654 RepID=A0A0K1QAJ6_9BACT|nr:ASPIC/UnbV domain-containing protein [Labilithrix luteola]